MKLAKRCTGRSKIISFKNSYHGSTQGALSVMGSEYWQQAFRPLFPNIFQFSYESEEVLSAIDTQTACVILELVQSESGVTTPTTKWLHRLQQKCRETGCLLIVDEIQTGFGRTSFSFRFPGRIQYFYRIYYYWVKRSGADMILLPKTFMDQFSRKSGIGPHYYLWRTSCMLYCRFSFARSFNQ